MFIRLGASGVSKEDFILNVMYLDPGGGEKRYLPEGPKAGVSINYLFKS
jgi:hypothetical protein